MTRSLIRLSHRSSSVDLIRSIDDVKTMVVVAIDVADWLNLNVFSGFKDFAKFTRECFRDDNCELLLGVIIGECQNHLRGELLSAAPVFTKTRCINVDRVTNQRVARNIKC